MPKLQMSCSPQGLGNGNYARRKLDNTIRVMIARKYKPKIIKDDDKQHREIKVDTHSLIGIFKLLENYNTSINDKGSQNTWTYITSMQMTGGINKLVRQGQKYITTQTYIYFHTNIVNTETGN